MKAVLVFCEGRHDVVFTQRSLGAHGGCKWVDKPIGELPSPFGPGGVGRKGLVARRFERYALEDRTLQDAASPSMPSFASIVENTATGTVFFLIEAGGQDRSHPNLELLEELKVTFDSVSRGTFDVSDYSAAFLFDANGEGVTSTLETFRDCYGSHFGNLSNLEHGRWAETSVPVGCFVFHGQDRTGTLEDHLAPMVARAWPGRYAGAERFVDESRAAGDEVSKSGAKRLKAVITAAGQFDHPGDPMSKIIGHAGLPAAQFEESRVSRELADFLAAAPRNDDASER